ncbi:MAG: beta-lactamase family protein [Bacteroidales bacterium]|jgi:CubicO group peptidase (beta-lactamase class C family)|nr:beta-lactamase family protein [Bacteroidales bacterium]
MRTIGHLNILGAKRLITFTLALFLACPVSFPVSHQPGSSNTKTDERIEALVKALHGEVEGYIGKGDVVGAELLIIKDGKALVNETFGWKDREDSLLMTPGVLFNIRSMSKVLTGVAVMTLIDEGKINYNDKLGEFFSSLDGTVLEKITISQLLSHTSGLPLSLITDAGYMTKWASLEEMVLSIRESDIILPPGYRFWYSDAGADFLGAVVEKVTGELIEDYIGRKVLNPLGMTSTRVITSGKKYKGDVVSLYLKYGDRWVKGWSQASNPLYPFAWGSQSFYSTPSDYSRLMMMIMNRGEKDNVRVLSRRLADSMLSPLNPMNQLGGDLPVSSGFPGYSVKYGQMMIIYEPGAIDKGHPLIFGHSGSDGTMSYMIPDLGLAILLFTQSRNNPVRIGFEKAIFKSLYGSAHSNGEQESSATHHTGRYISRADGSWWEIHHEGGFRVLSDSYGNNYLLKDPDDEQIAFISGSNNLKIQYVNASGANPGGIRIYRTYEWFRDLTAKPDEYLKTDVDSLKKSQFAGRYRNPVGGGSIEAVYKNDLLLKLRDGSVIDLLPAGRELEYVEKDSPENYVSFEYCRNAGYIMRTTEVMFFESDIASPSGRVRE